MSIYDLFIEPATHEFIQRAMIAAILVGTISGLVGSYVVVRGMSFFGDALAHSVLPGVATAYIVFGGNPEALFAGGLIAGILSALGIGFLTRGGRLKEDTAIGIVFAAMFALGIAIISTNPRAYGRDLVHILFGNVFVIRDTDIFIMIACAIAIIAVIILFYKELLLISFDQELAQTLRLPAEALRILLLVLIAVTIVASLQMVGVTLMLAMLVTPPATARLVVHRLHQMMLVSAFLGAVSGITGIYLAYHLNIVTGPAIVLTITTIFLLTLAVTRLREWGDHFR